MEDTSVNSRRQEIIGCTNGMNVACQMKIKVLHRNDLGVATTCGSTFNAKSGSLTGLTNTSHRLALKMSAESLRQANGCGGLAFAQGCGCDASDNDVLTESGALESTKDIKRDFSL